MVNSTCLKNVVFTSHPGQLDLQSLDDKYWTRERAVRSENDVVLRHLAQHDAGFCNNIIHHNDTLCDGPPDHCAEN